MCKKQVYDKKKGVVRDLRPILTTNFFFTGNALNVTLANSEYEYEMLQSTQSKSSRIEMHINLKILKCDLWFLHVRLMPWLLALISYIDTFARWAELSSLSNVMFCVCLSA